MKVSGGATLYGPVERVYEVLNDPAVLVRTIPGCQRLEQVAPDSYRAVVTAGVASIKGTYAGEVVLADQQAPHSFVLKASGSGAPGTVSAEVRIRLAPEDDGATALTYDADAVVGGTIGGVGQRILAGVAKRTAGEFFAAVNDVLTGAAEPAAGTAVGEVEPAGVRPAVFTRPAAPARTGLGLPGGDFALGVVFGAAAAVIGALVGGRIARRSR